MKIPKPDQHKTNTVLAEQLLTQGRNEIEKAMFYLDKKKQYDLLLRLQKIRWEITSIKKLLDEK